MMRSSLLIRYASTISVSHSSRDNVGPKLKGVIDKTCLGLPAATSDILFWGECPVSPFSRPRSCFFLTPIGASFEVRYTTRRASERTVISKLAKRLTRKMVDSSQPE